MLPLKKKRNGWITPQIEALSLGIRARLPYQVMADALGRSVESVRKASERHLGHLLDPKKRGRKCDKEALSAMPADHYLMTLDKWCQTHRYRLESVLCPKALRKLKKIPTNLTLTPMYGLCQGDGNTIPMKRRRRYVPSKILTMADLCCLLAREGHTVRETNPVINGKRDREKFYIMNGAVLSAGEVLLSVNRRRTSQGLHPLYIDDVTEF